MLRRLRLGQMQQESVWNLVLGNGDLGSVLSAAAAHFGGVSSGGPCSSTDDDVNRYWGGIQRAAAIRFPFGVILAVGLDCRDLRRGSTVDK